MLKPWISKEILRKCKDSDFILKYISKEMNPAKKSALGDGYKKLRNEIDKRDSKKTYYSSYFEKNKQKSSEIWKVINSLVNIKSSKTSIIKLLEENNNLVTDPRIISHKFNHYFSTILLLKLFQTRERFTYKYDMVEYNYVVHKQSRS